MTTLSEELKERFKVYPLPNLKSISKEDFCRIIQSRLGEVDTETERYSEDELEKQRDLSVKFHWGHNHDFGEFALEGRMGDRHIDLLVNFVSLFHLIIEDFKDKAVLDVGCWTGGTTLLLASLGSNVIAIEEVRKYAETASFLVKSFGLEDRVSIRPISVYECVASEFNEQFDIVYFPGVIYHLSDPLLALRILFNSLKVGGIILIESAGLNIEEPFCRFDGSLVYASGTRERLNRSGWNWFIPSPLALSRMMREAGFDEIKTLYHDETARVYGFGKKAAQVGICKAGLSMPDIK